MTSRLPKAVRFDPRGPYGVLDFDAGTSAVWADGFYKFSATEANGLTWQTPFTWNTPWKAARFHALVFGGRYEMGLPLPSGQSLFTDGWADCSPPTGSGPISRSTTAFRAMIPPPARR
jgi:hypothetical protein